VVVAVAGTPSAASASTATWSPPATLSAASNGQFRQDVAVSASGETVAVWSRTGSNGSRVFAASRPAGGEWSAAVALSAAGDNAAEPSVAIRSDGNAVAVWVGGPGGARLVRGAIRSPDGTWAPPQDVSVPSAVVSSPRMAFDGLDVGVAVWTRSNGTNMIVQAARMRPSLVWQEPSDVSPVGEDASLPDISLASDGQGLLVWQVAGAPVAIKASVHRPHAMWASPVPVSEAGLAGSGPSAVMDATGAGLVVWEQTGTVMSAVLQPTDEWEAPVSVGRGSSPSTDIDDAGVVVAAWRVPASGTGGARIVARTRAAQQWGTPAVISRHGGDTALPDVASAPDGAAVTVAWADDRRLLVRAASTTGSGWDEATVGPSVAGATASVDSAAGGTAVAVFAAPAPGGGGTVEQGSVGTP
jgi:hypothetical protein